MSNEKEMSALEWFHQKTWDLKIQLESGEISIGEYANTYATLYQQAKEIFEQQIKNAFARGNCLYGYETTESMQKIYYEKTYGGNK